MNTELPCWPPGSSVERHRLTKAWTTWNTGNTREPILPASRSTLADFHGETVQLMF